MKLSVLFIGDIVYPKPLLDIIIKKNSNNKCIDFYNQEYELLDGFDYTQVYGVMDERVKILINQVDFVCWITDSKSFNDLSNIETIKSVLHEAIHTTIFVITTTKLEESQFRTAVKQNVKIVTFDKNGKYLIHKSSRKNRIEKYSFALDVEGHFQRKVDYLHRLSRLQAFKYLNLRIFHDVRKIWLKKLFPISSTYGKFIEYYLSDDETIDAVVKWQDLINNKLADAVVSIYGSDTNRQAVKLNRVITSWLYYYVYFTKMFTKEEFDRIHQDAITKVENISMSILQKYIDIQLGRACYFSIETLHAEFQLTTIQRQSPGKNVGLYYVSLTPSRETFKKYDVILCKIKLIFEKKWNNKSIMPFSFVAKYPTFKNSHATKNTFRHFCMAVFHNFKLREDIICWKEFFETETPTNILEMI
jgi:hypothetical protein